MIEESGCTYLLLVEYLLVTYLNTYIPIRIAWRPHVIVMRKLCSSRILAQLLVITFTTISTYKKIAHLC
jgi:hypothetical protein